MTEQEFQRMDANLLFTVIDTDYHDNKIDAIIRKLREYEPE